MPQDVLIRLGFFVGLFVLFASLEAMFPRRKLQHSRWQRWATNLGLSVINTIALRLMGPIVAVTAAAWAGANNWGLLNNVTLPQWMAILAAVLALDLAVFGQHVATHRLPVLWRLHRVHHADQDLDASSGLRFHPIEIFLSMIYKSMVVIALGPAVVAVVAYEIVLNGAALFNHANLALPKWLDKAIRVIAVTPDMHRVHHSVVPNETNSNYGNMLSVWDRLFGTYRAAPCAGQLEMIIGLNEYQDAGPERLIWSLRNPFSNS